MNDLLGNEIKIGDWVAQLRPVYNTSTINAECGIISNLDEENGKVYLVSVYDEPPVHETWYKDRETWEKAVEKQKRNGFVSFSKRKCDVKKVILTYPDKSQAKLIKRYEKASGKKLVDK